MALVAPAPAPTVQAVAAVQAAAATRGSGQDTVACVQRGLLLLSNSLYLLLRWSSEQV